MKIKRLAPGFYEVDTAKGTFTIDRIEGSGGYDTAWYITWPGQSRSDEVTNTLREAKAAILIAAVEGEQDARALWNHEDEWVREAAANFRDWAESDRYAAASDRIANIQNEY